MADVAAGFRGESESDAVEEGVDSGVESATVRGGSEEIEDDHARLRSIELDLELNGPSLDGPGEGEDDEGVQAVEETDGIGQRRALDSLTIDADSDRCDGPRARRRCGGADEPTVVAGV